MTLGLTLLAPAAASAEFLRIEQSLTALDCASCAQSLAGRMKRMWGVESAELTPDGFLRLQLKPDNAVRLETIRDLAKGGGFTPKEAKVKVRGTAVETGGKWELQIEGLDQSYSLERAFEGIKRLYYRGGTAAACRGTGSGPPQYYRTRPMGYFEMSLFNGAMAPRAV